MENPYRAKPKERKKKVRIQDERSQFMDIQESRDDPPDFYRSKDNIFNYDWRDDLSQSQNTNTQD